MPISSVAQAKTGFHSLTSPFLRHFSATVLGRSNTHTSGAPPQLARCCAKLRTRLSTVSSFTSETRTQREYFRREAKKWSRSTEPSRNSTSTCPKSCWLNSPGSPSKRTRGLTSLGRKEATSAYSALLPPV